jgi:RNA polymerase sigma factor (sigma-70 family)
LFVKVAAADPDAWRRLSDAVVPYVRAKANEAGVPSHDAEDLAQEVCAEAAEHVHGLHGPRKGDLLCKWIHTTTRHKIADYFRARKCRAEGEGIGGSQPDLAEIAEANRETVDFDPHTDDGRTVILRAAMALVRAVVAPRTWQAFEGVVLEGRSVAEVALELGVLPNFVRDAVYRVRRRVIEIAKRLAANGGRPVNSSPLQAGTRFDGRRLPL